MQLSIFLFMISLVWISNKTRKIYITIDPLSWLFALNENNDQYININLIMLVSRHKPPKKDFY